MNIGQLTEEIFEDRVEAFGVTIDGLHSLDLDDAIYLERTSNGYVVHVSIADVGSVVKINSDIDNFAFERGATQYFRNGNKPMLPRELSENLLSLLEGKKRPTITISIPISYDLELGEPTIRRTFLVNSKKLSYEEADKIIESGDETFLREAYSLSLRLFEQRKASGALTFFDTRIGLSTTEEGNLMSLDHTERFNSNLLIQEFMILPNRILPVYFAENNIPGLFRNHSAILTAPPRGNLLQDMETALVEGNYKRLETFSQRLRLVLSNALYAETISGHYGLNLPAYMHFTSPIRRYGDLINARQLTAFLLGESLPYDLDHLAYIAERINVLDRQRKDEKSNYFLEKKIMESIELARYGNLEELDAQDFHRVIKTAAKRALFTPEIEEQIHLRLEAGKLREKDIYTILLDCERENEGWSRIREDVIAWLEHSPHFATSIITMATQSLQWTTPVYENLSGGQDHRRTFTSTGSLMVKGENFVSHPQTATSIKAAEQLAALSLLERILGLESKSRNLATYESEKNVSVPDKNYKGILKEMCDAKRWNSPVYEAIQGFKSRFTVVAQLTINETVYYSDPSGGEKLVWAQQLAAASLLEKIANLGSVLVKSQRPVEKKLKKVPGNYGIYISKLDGFHIQLGFENPTYAVKEIDGGYSCHYEVKAPDGVPTSFYFEAKGRHDAIRGAAKAAYDALAQQYKEAVKKKYKN